jgi:hypothetical protein
MIDLAPLITVVLAVFVSIVCTIVAVRWMARETKQHIDASVAVLVQEIKEGRQQAVTTAHEIAKDAQH